MPKSDPQDAGFVSVIEKMLGFSREQINKRLDDLNATDLIDLTDAVTKRNKKLVSEIIGPVDEENNEEDIDMPAKEPKLNKLLQQTKQKSAVERGRKDDAEQEDTDLEIGEDVMVGDKEATVKIPQGPHGSVGVVINGKLHMVKRGEVTTLKESIDQMFQPDLFRILSLAGVLPTTETEQTAPEVAPEVIPVPSYATSATSDATIAGTPECPEHALELAMNALETLTRVLPGVRQADVRNIRKTLNDVLWKLNESVRPRRSF